MKGQRIGLVLSGGGAKGAYQVGVVRAICELGLEVSAISGASIGALNGAVIASSGSLERAVERLGELWGILAEDPPLGDEVPNLIKLLEGTGLPVDPALRSTAKLAKAISHNLLPTITNPDTGSLVDNGAIKKLMDEYISIEQLAEGPPLYVSVFPSGNMVESLIGSGLAALQIKENTKSQFIHVQSLPREDQRKALLASAAIPLLLESQEIGGERYNDGGLGGVRSSQGNTPILPLLENGYDPVIVTSLSDRTRWITQLEQLRERYPAARLIEVERIEPIDRTLILPEVFDIVSFHPKKIQSWIKQGYGDAIRCLSTLKEAQIG